MNRISDSRIVGRPLLDRCHADRNDDKANRARWDDPAAQLLLIDPYDKVVMAHDRVVAVPTEGERDDQHDLLPAWCRRRGALVYPSYQRATSGGSECARG